MADEGDAVVATGAEGESAGIAPIAHPLASDKLTKKCLKLVKKGAYSLRAAAGATRRAPWAVAIVPTPVPRSRQEQVYSARRQGGCQGTPQG
jgi:hypothetical protein